MTRRIASLKSSEAVGNKGKNLSDLIARDGCGPERFVRTDDAV
jgi:hypothetical protein